MERGVVRVMCARRGDQSGVDGLEGMQLEKSGFEVGDDGVEKGALGGTVG